jgi:hypothetical protein
VSLNPALFLISSQKVQRPLSASTLLPQLHHQTQYRGKRRAMEENHKITRTLRAHHGLLDEVKTTLLSICERLSTPHFKSISDTLLAPKHVVALILALSKDLAEWVTDHHELIVQQSQVVQHNRILEAHEALVRQAKQMAEKQKYLEFENDIYRRMFMEPENPKDIAQLRIAGLARFVIQRSHVPAPLTCEYHAIGQTHRILGRLSRGL